MNIGLHDIAANVGMQFELIILFLLLVGGLIFYVNDVRIGVIMHMLSFGLGFMWFYQSSMNFAPALVIFLMFFVILCFTIYAVSKSSSQGSSFQ